MKKFNASQFTATEWSSPEDKAKFCNQFVRFVEGGFKREQFPKWFYTRLSMTFGHIAHYNQDGFYRTFFTSTNNICYFLQETLAYPCSGFPEYTYSDAEKVIQAWITENNILSKWMQKNNQEIESKERAELARLQAKYS